MSNSNFLEAMLGSYSFTDGHTLDVGCGSAPYRGAVRGRYLGVDYAISAGKPSAASLRCGAECLPFADDSFDLVFSKSAFYQFPNPDCTLAEFRRVLKPGGRLLLVDYNRRAQKRLSSGEGSLRPGWTFWELRSRVKKAGFRECECLAPTVVPLCGPRLWLRLLREEVMGDWAIVTGLK